MVQLFVHAPEPDRFHRKRVRFGSMLGSVWVSRATRKRNMIDKSTSDNIKMLGVVMTAAIVMYHCGPTASSSVEGGAVDLWLNDHVSIAFNQIGILAMSYFFTVTGFLLFSGLSYGKIPLKIKKRVKTLLIPYIVWELIATCYYVALGRVYSFGAWVSTVFLFNTWPPDGALWYVYSIFILACCSYVLLPLLSNSKIGGVAVFICFFACYFFCNTSNAVISSIVSYGYLGNVLVYLPAYILGAYIGLHFDNKTSMVTLCVSLLLVGFIFSAYMGDSIGFVLAKCLPSLVILLFSLPVIKGESTVYKVTFLVYALHQPLLGTLGSAIRNCVSCIPSMAVANISFRVFYCLVIFGLAIALYYFLKKMNAPFVTSLLTGGRAERKIETAG